MRDSRLNDAERRLQRLFSKSAISGSLALAVPIFAAAGWSMAQPNRQPMADAAVIGRAEAVPVVGEVPAPAVAARLWRLNASDRRFGGLSAVVVDRGELLALTDSGVTVGFAPPADDHQSVRFRLHDLPDGPGDARRKRGRDSEALIADPAGRGWWVSFEWRHSLWRYDSAFKQALETRWLKQDWPRNRGAEALIADRDGSLSPLPEGGDAVTPAGVSDATRLADGRRVLLVRRLGWRGFANEVRIEGGVGRPQIRLWLPLGPLDNAEAITAAPLANGGVRLWIMTDDNFRPWMRTLLVALDLPPGA